MKTVMLSWPEYSSFAASLLAILTSFAAAPVYLTMARVFVRPR
jgi:hypothetical protein